ncbi:MAG: PucR family transcriptional regulator [Pseudomonadota bacterium]
MTNIITRYFDSPARARAVRFELVERQRFSADILSLYTEAEGLDATLAAEHVDPATAAEYARRMAGGGAVLLVRAGFRPLSVAQTARQVTREMGAVALEGFEEEVFVPDSPSRGLSVLQGGPLMLTRRRDPLRRNYHMADWPIGLISRRKPPADSVFRGYMTAFAFPLLDGRKPYTKSIIPRHARMANWPIPLLSARKPYTGSIFPRHARMAAFPIPLISRRKPFNRSIFPKHQRMATVPFPLLINGKTGTNALIPGGPRMANFPIPLLSGRKPFTGSIFPRHARMAAFPIPLLSKRTPYTGSIIPKHARMADRILPLTVSREKFSFSKALGLETLSKR